ncbi:hypothetical protein WCP94_001030 [Bilophila wadsworthia]
MPERGCKRTFSIKKAVSSPCCEVEQAHPMTERKKNFPAQRMMQGGTPFGEGRGL